GAGGFAVRSLPATDGTDFRLEKKKYLLNKAGPRLVELAAWLVRFWVELAPRLLVHSLGRTSRAAYSTSRGNEQARLLILPVAGMNKQGCLFYN
ncbi:MAG: hypothetical protein ACPGWR_20985, partial [Ardenticatenaceae bacterium]